MSRYNNLSAILSNLQSKTSDLQISKPKKVYLMLLVVLGFSLSVSGINKTFIILLVVLDTFISKWMARSGPAGLGIETASLATIIAGITLSPLLGAITGIICVFLRMLVGLSGAFILWKFPGFAMLGFLSGYLLDSLFPLGILLLGVMRAVFILCSKFLDNKGIGSEIAFSVTNLIFVYTLSMRLSTSTFIL